MTTFVAKEYFDGYREAAQEEIDRLRSQIENAKRGLVWAWHGNVDTSVVDWDAYFDDGEM